MSAKRFMIIFTILTLSLSGLFMVFNQRSLFFFFFASVSLHVSAGGCKIGCVCRVVITQTVNYTLVIFVFRSHNNLWMVYVCGRLSAHILQMKLPPALGRGIVWMPTRRTQWVFRRDCFILLSNHRAKPLSGSTSPYPLLPCLAASQVKWLLLGSFTTGFNVK